MEEILYRYNPWWEGEYKLDGIIERPTILARLKEHADDNQVVFLTGLRRVGKTTLMKLLIKYLINEKKINDRHIFFISLDDYLLGKSSIPQIVEEYRKIHKLKFEEKIYIFLDEVAYKDSFEQQLKNIHDSQNVKIYASSSSASILKSKKPYLTGRHVTIEVMPLDFTEYLTFKNIVIRRADAHLKDKYFEDYLLCGGMPEYVLRGQDDYLKELVDDIIFKDIASFYNIKKPQILKDFFLLLMERAGKAVSVNKVANILGISVDTAKRYLQMFADTYLIYLVGRYGKTNAKILAPKKVYAADLGVRNLFTGFRDKGSLFENYVYLKIKDKNPCYVYEGGNEIDFLTTNGDLLEVKYHSEFNEKQKRLFDGFKAGSKVVIKNISDLEKYLL